MTEAVFDAPPDLRNAFGDGSVALPETIPRPDEWPNRVLEDGEFYGRWRGWLETGPDAELWSNIAPEGFWDVEAIPPDPAFRWVDRAEESGCFRVNFE